ncbi:MAG: hypothetical protein V1726_06835 [Methanobacteriota archaeon]
MGNEHSLEEIRMKAHQVNCELSEEGFSAREIEVIGYYLNRIAASYLSFFTHKEYEKTLKEAPSSAPVEESYPPVKE